MNKLFKPLWALLLLAFSAPLAVAQEAEAAASNIDSGDTAWMLTATVLVLLMTIPGLSLFYGGLVKSKNILSVLMQCFFITAVMSVLWVIFGYSFATGKGVADGGSALFGDFTNMFLKNLTPEADAGLTIPESVFITFQMTFIIITPALIVGAFAERMKFSAVLIFTILWAILSYCPIWHMAWGGGLFAEWGAIDFAGGTVVHINAGVAGLVACIMLGKRKGYPNTLSPPSSVPFTIIGAALLWVGWFGFNAGSAVSAGADAGYAMLTTQIATAAAVIAWVAVESLTTGKPTAVGAATGAVAGLVAITPASGSTDVIGALVIGVASGVLCYFGATSLKKSFGYDDSLDVFGVHGIGGIVGAILTGVFIREGAGDAGMTQVIIQAKAVLVTIIWSAVAAVIALTVAKVTVGLRVDEGDEETGLDQSSHGESAYS
ncbi:MAG: ammonium transporter [Verrucomicrobiota bacterium]|nr:ammonium transporter [Verrucomicrobiota bacterium]MEC8905827.1 ammonium transporter [Verrucomicrobiota bacterium]MED6299893.1 ammonium transporter [Verrucomicrobiota bacterium]